MKIWIYSLLPLILCSCFNKGADQWVGQVPNTKKAKQKIAVLQKRLEIAKKVLEKAELEVENLISEIDWAQLMLIRKKIEDFELKGQKSESRFLQERELLYQMIQSGPSPSAFEAQVELDRILRIITETSDDGNTL